MVEKQAKFLLTLSDFIKKSMDKGYQFTAGEAWRSPDEARLNSIQGDGIRNSLHISRLAMDLNAFFKGEWLDGSKDSHIPHLEELGKLWESLDANCAWGGRFTKKDYNHYSFKHNGIR